MTKQPADSAAWTVLRQNRVASEAASSSARISVLIASTRQKGTLNQCLGVARVLEEMLRLRGIDMTVTRLDAWGVVKAKLPLLRRWQKPTVVLSCGSAGEGRARRFVSATPGALWAHIEVQGPATPAPDLVFVSRHDWRREFDDAPAYIALDGVPHSIRQSDLTVRRKDARRQLGLAGNDRMVAVLIGGENPAFGYSETVRDRIAGDLLALTDTGRKVFVTGSRRTDPALMTRLRALQRPGLTVYDGKAANPYRDYLAAADALLVSEDSITMCCEAFSTGKPVSLLRLEPRPGARLDKFRRFQAHVIETLGLVGNGFEHSPDGAIPDDAARVAERILAALRLDKTLA